MSETPEQQDKVALPHALPWSLKVKSDPEPLGWLYIGALVIFGVGNAIRLATDGDLSFLERLPLFVLGAVPLLVIEGLSPRLVLDSESLRTRGVLTDRTIPWSRVTEISRSGDEVVVRYGDRTRKLEFDGEEGKPSSSEVAEVMRTLRAQARGLIPRVSVRLSWGAYAAVAYVACLWVVAGFVF